MSGHSKSKSAPVEERFRLEKMGFAPWILLVVGVVCLAGTVVWGCFDHGQFVFSWLTGFMFCFTICAGALFWTLLHHAVDADWSVVVRRLLETLASLFLPVLVILFVPVWLCREQLYAWWSVNPVGDAGMAHKSWWLNHGFFNARIVLYFTVFCFFGWMLRRLSVRQDVSGDPWLSVRMRQVAYAGLPLFAISITFVAVDWMMSLDYHWYSTMWGVYIFAGAAGSSMAVLILIANALRRGGYLAGVFTVEHNHIMGKLLFAFTIFWAYIAFSQYMLIYYANIPEETIFFIQRNEGSWHQLSIFLVFARFFVPFLLLLTQAAKRTPVRLCFAAGWVVAMHFVDVYWIIMPVLSERSGLEGMGIHPLQLLVPVGMVCLLAWVFLRRLSRCALFPVKDPRLYESVNLVN